MELTSKEMKQIDGGAIHWGVIAAIGTGLVYIIGIFSGYTNPNKCNNK